MALNRLRCFRVSAAAKEAAFLVGNQAQIDQMIPVNTTTFPTPEHTFETEEDLLTCTLESNEQVLVAKNNTMSVDVPRVRPNALAFFVAYALGDVMTTSFSTDFANVRRHKIEISSDDDLPSFTLEEEIESNIAALYQGCGVLDFSITASLGTTRTLDLSANLNMAKRTGGTNPDDATQVAESPLNAAKSAIFLGTGKYDGKGGNIYGVNGGEAAPYANLVAGPNGRANIDTNPANITARVHSITWSYNNNINLDGLYRLGGGLFPSVWKRGSPSQTVDVNFDYTDESEFDRFDEQTDLALQWSTESGAAGTAANYDPDGAANDFAAGKADVYFGFNAVWPKVRYQGYQRAEVDGSQVIQATFTVLQPQGETGTANSDAAKRGSEKSVELYVWNKWSGYAG